MPAFATADPRHRRLDRFLLPATALMNRLRYPQKFALICLLFSLPLALVMYLLISEINGRIDFAEKELMGDKYLRPLRGLLQHLAQSQVQTHDYTTNGVVVTAKSLTDQDRLRLDGYVEKIFQKESFSDDKLLAEVSDLVRVCLQPRARSQAQGL